MAAFDFNEQDLLDNLRIVDGTEAADTLGDIASSNQHCCEHERRR